MHMRINIKVASANNKIKDNQTLLFNDLFLLIQTTKEVMRSTIIYELFANVFANRVAVIAK